MPYDHDLLAAIRASAQSLADAADALNSDFAPEDRVGRFLHRLDHITSTMSPEGKRHYLRAVGDTWARRWTGFICRHQGAFDPDVPEDELDGSYYLLIFVGILRRLNFEVE